MKNRQKNHLSLGKEGEMIARRCLNKKGYRIIASNYKVKLGEIDIIADHGKDLVFIEVKTRSGTSYGTPAEAVNLRKQLQIIKVAQCFLKENNCFDRPVRFDVVSVLMKSGEKPKIEVIKNAFEE